MASSQSASMTSKITPQSGTFEIPKILPYPDYYDYSELARLENIYCYIQEYPKDVDLTMLIYRDVKQSDVYTLFSDAFGNLIELDKDESSLAQAARDIIKELLAPLVNLMNIMKIPQAQYHFASDGLILVDVRTAINKYASPGMLEDVFGKIIRTLKTRLVTTLDKNIIEAIIQGQGSFTDDLLIRPSRFRLMDDTQQDMIPLYVGIRR